MSPLSHGEMVQMARMHGNSCVICGEEIPEGRMVCPVCEKQEPKSNLSHEKKLIRLIDAEELKHILNNSKYYGTKTGNAFADMITECKTIEARKKGKWILSDEQRQEDVDNGNYRFICSECGKSDLHSKAVLVSFCWNCGTDMRGEDNE